METSSILNQLFERYQLEGLNMPYTMEDFRREVLREYVESLSPEELRQQFPIERVFEGCSIEEQGRIIEQLPPETQRQIIEQLPPEARRWIFRLLPAEERLNGLSVEEIRAYLQQVENQDGSEE